MEETIKNLLAILTNHIKVIETRNEWLMEKLHACGVYPEMASDSESSTETESETETESDARF